MHANNHQTFNANANNRPAYNNNANASFKAPVNNQAHYEAAPHNVEQPHQGGGQPQQHNEPHPNNAAAGEDTNTASPSGRYKHGPQLCCGPFFH